MELVIFALLFAAILAIGIYQKRNTSPEVKACVSEISRYIRSEQTPKAERIVEIFTRHGQQRSQAQKITKLIPPRIKQGGNSRDDAMQAMAVVRAAVALLPETSGNNRNVS